MAQGTPTKAKKRKKSVLRAARHAERRAAINRANLTRVRTMIKRVRAAIGRGDTVEAGKLLSPTISAIDRAVTKGVLHRNTANRYKSRLTLAAGGMKK